MKNAMINGNSQLLDDTDKILARVIRYLNPDELSRAEKGKMLIKSQF